MALHITSKYKKTVFIVKKMVFKGLYACDDPGLLNNLKHMYAIQLFEEALHLPDWCRSFLPWEYIGCGPGDKYFLMTLNVGRHENICTELVTTKIEKDVPVIPRASAVWRISDMEKAGHLTDRIKFVTLQHLYFRFLLDIGDSGTRNVLFRDDNGTTGRLIAGIDLDEKRGIKMKDCQLSHLFKSQPSKRQKSLYGAHVSQIKTLILNQLNPGTLNRLDSVDIDLKRLKENIHLRRELPPV